MNQYVPDEKKVLANRATQIFGLIGGTTTFFGAMVSSRLGRRTMTIMGFLCVTLSHFMISYWITQHDGQMVLMFMILLQISLQVLVSPVFWMYLSETCNDK